MKHIRTYNEGIRDMMTPRSKVEVSDALEKILEGDYDTLLGDPIYVSGGNPGIVSKSGIMDVLGMTYPDELYCAILERMDIMLLKTHIRDIIHSFLAYGNYFKFYKRVIDKDIKTHQDIFDLVFGISDEIGDVYYRDEIFRRLIKLNDIEKTKTILRNLVYGNVNEGVRDMMRPISDDQIRIIYDNKSVNKNRNEIDSKISDKMKSGFSEFEAFICVLGDMHIKFTYIIPREEKSELHQLYKTGNNLLFLLVDREDIGELDLGTETYVNNMKKFGWKLYTFHWIRDYCEFIFTKSGKINEGIRDMMTPKSTKDIIDSFRGKSSHDKMILGARHGILELIKPILDIRISSPGIMDELFDTACKSGSINIVEYLMGLDNYEYDYTTYLSGVSVAIRNRHDDIAKYIKRHIVGKRVRLIKMDDVDPIQPGSRGTIVDVDVFGDLNMKWDNGRTLSVIVKQDQFEILGDRGITMNEGIRDMMTPKSEKDIINAIKHSSSKNKLKFAMRSRYKLPDEIIKDILDKLDTDGVIEYFLLASAYEIYDMCDLILDKYPEVKRTLIVSLEATKNLSVIKDNWWNLNSRRISKLFGVPIDKLCVINRNDNETVNILFMYFSYLARNDKDKIRIDSLGEDGKSDFGHFLCYPSERIASLSVNLEDDSDHDAEDWIFDKEYVLGKLYKEYGYVNEGIRDMMTPKSDTEIQHELIKKYNIKPEIFEFLNELGYKFRMAHDTVWEDSWRITIEFRNEAEKNSVYFLPGEPLVEIKKRIK